ncbi:hypothetical protein [Streptomyces sp. NPDC051561]|uniref:hypothetical protein n=1 Tax=Streptomyces sp. NPDC051561 TaxID=3365658 RepID=UPI00378F5071
MRRFTEDDFGLTWLMNSFHADWSNYAESEAEALRTVLHEDLDPRQVVSLRRDAYLLSSQLSETSIVQLWEAGVEVPNFFGRRLPSGRDWMEMIIQECDRWLPQGGIPSLREADLEHGFNHSEEIQNEIREMTDVISVDLVLGLTECARLCTPDLAFRILLHALMCSGSTISENRYRTFERIGTELYYGEFLVSKVQHLVGR